MDSRHGMEKEVAKFGERWTKHLSSWNVDKVVRSDVEVYILQVVWLQPGLRRRIGSQTATYVTHIR